MRMRAVRDGDDYLLTGSKRFITDGSVANVVTVFAADRSGAGGRKGLSGFIVETDTPGFSVARLEHKMGIRGSPTAELHFDEVRVPAANRLGEEGDGFKIAMATLDRSRLADRRPGGGDRPGSHRLRRRPTPRSGGSSATGSPTSRPSSSCSPTWRAQTEAARQLVYAACTRVDDDDPNLAYWTSSAKLIAGDTAMRVTTDAVQVWADTATQRVPGRADDARREDHPAVRGHPADPAPGHGAPVSADWRSGRAVGR